MAEAYVRDSTDQQDVDHQRYGVLVSARTRRRGPLVGPARLARAGGGRLLTAPTQGGDLVRCADVHRIVRSTQTVPPLPLLWWGVRATLPCKPHPNEEPRRETEKAATRALSVRP